MCSSVGHNIKNSIFRRLGGLAFADQTVSVIQAEIMHPASVGNYAYTWGRGVLRFGRQFRVYYVFLDQGYSNFVY